MFDDLELPDELPCALDAWGPTRSQASALIAENGMRIPPPLLQCALFEAAAPFRPQARKKREYVSEKLFSTAYGSQIGYRGVRLNQTHAAVLFALLHAARGTSPDRELLVNPRSFAVQKLAWADHPASGESFVECLADLRGALVTLPRREGQKVWEVSITLLSGFERDLDTNRVRVKFDPSILKLFGFGSTYLPRGERLQLRDGLETWTWGFVKSGGREKPIKLEKLREISGSNPNQPLKEFGRALRKALVRLREIGAIDGFSIDRGIVTIRKLK